MNGLKSTIFVTPVKDDRYIRYRSWVEEKREYVHRKSGGKIGYVHIPDMGLNGFSEFFRLYGVEAEMESLIVDVRYNGGGSVSQLFLCTYSLFSSTHDLYLIYLSSLTGVTKIVLFNPFFCLIPLESLVLT